MRTSARRQLSRGMTTAAGRVKSTTQIHAVDGMVALGAASLQSGRDRSDVCFGGRRWSRRRRCDDNRFLNGWLHPDVGFGHDPSPAQRENQDDTARDLCHGCTELPASTEETQHGLTVDHRALTCQTSVARRNRRAVKLCVVHLIGQIMRAMGQAPDSP